MTFSSNDGNPGAFLDTMAGNHCPRLVSFLLCVFPYISLTFEEQDKILGSKNVSDIIFFLNIQRFKDTIWSLC
jgi:hypothetical protein